MANIIGTNGNDRLSVAGSSGNNLLNGDAGDDTLDVTYEFVAGGGIGDKLRL
ncbi:hypothetical protein LC612_32855 [Nostoc sp. CHAB 5834]|nr:hypothetical protein [Nostoc sp. CHAB 5834]